ncbi:MAG: integrin alpha [bacterium]
MLFLIGIGFAQPEKRARFVETYNLEIIWERGTPGDSLFFTYGAELSSGDFNGDGYSDIVIEGDSAVDRIHGIYIFKAYIFFGGPQFDTIPDIVIASDTTWGFLRVRGIDDINGDEFDDLALGSQHGPDNYGRVYVYLGGNPMDTICDFQIRGPHSGSAFGQAVGSGDVNSDGYSDVIVGAYMARPPGGGYGMGQVFIYFGDTNFNTVPNVRLNGGHENDLEGFGSTVSGGGDVNGDGYGDVIIGAGNFGPALQGRVYIYFGGDPMNTVYDVAMSG